MKNRIYNLIPTFIFLILFLGFFVGLSCVMGLQNMLGTFMQTAYHLLLETVLYIMAICVMTGAISKLLSNTES